MSEAKRDIIELPTAFETEEDVLGTCLQEGSFWWSRVESAAEGADITDLFFHSEHRTVAKAMTSLYGSSTPITLATVTDELMLYRESQSLVPTPAQYLATLQSVARLKTPDDVAAAAKKLLEKLKLRKQIVGMRDITERASSEQPNPNDIASELHLLATEQSMVTSEISRFGEQMDAFQELMGKTVSVRASTGITSLDELLHGGFGGGSLTIIAARPKVGKTTVILNSLLSNLEEGFVVVFVSLELGYKELHSKLLASLSMVAQKDIAAWLDNKRKLTDFSEEEQEELRIANEALRSSLFYPLYSKDIPHGMDSIIAAVWKAQQNHPDSKIVLYIDYAQLLAEGAKNRQAEIGQIARKSKLFAQEMNMPVIMAAQVRRPDSDSEDGMPRASQLRESGDLEQTADTVILLNRKSLQDEDFPPHVMDIHVELTRNGEPGWATAYYRPQIQYICDLSEATESIAELQAESAPFNDEPSSEPSADDERVF